MRAAKIRTELLDANAGQVAGVPQNPRSWTHAEMKRMRKSLRECPELFEARGCIVYPQGGRYVVMGGNFRLAAAKANGLQEVPCIVLDADMSAAKLREIALKDNASFGAWDFDELANKWDDCPLVEWGIPAWKAEDGGEPGTEESEYERQKREFEERIAAGEMDEGDEEYQAFLEKFRPKKTTDDCFTPEPVYEVVAGYVEKRYGKRRKDFVRPFYPGGDYERYDYPKGCVVVDNPPFSILAKILKFYAARGIDYFLFAPGLTVLNSGDTACVIALNVTVIYANGAFVNTSFATSLEPGVRLRSDAGLYRELAEAAEECKPKANLPKYSYPSEVVTTPMVGRYSKYGVEYCVPRDECVRVSALDAQGDGGVFGGGLIVSERAAAERAAAERAAAERAAAERAAAVKWQLSEREQAIVRKLSQKGKGYGKEENDGKAAGES